MRTTKISKRSPERAIYVSRQSEKRGLATNIMNRQIIYEKIIMFLKKEDVEQISVFGSYVRCEENAESDIDIIVEFSKRKSLLDLVRIERQLSEFLGIKVDLLTEKSISPYIIDSIRNEMKVIYA